MIKKAINYLNGAKTPKKFKNKFHYDVPTGWMNDPNGCIKAFGKYHIFYQFYPYDSTNGPMHWGHVVTNDFIHWDTYPPALAPDEAYDKDGCWSGSAIMHNGLLWLMYTGCCDEKQQQCLAYSEDGINFKKYCNNPVIRTEQLPQNSIYYSFRDPYLIKKDDIFYVLLGGRDIKDNCGRVMLYRSENLFDWEYVGDPIKGYDMIDPGIYECPCYANLEDQEILVASLNFTPNQGDLYQNFANPVYYIGQMDFNTAKFNHKGQSLIDYGFDFYAPQFISSDEKRKIIISWLQMWEQTYPTQEYGWVGSLSLPREVKICNNKLQIYPVSELVDNLELFKQFCVKKGTKNINYHLEGRHYCIKHNFDLVNSGFVTIRLVFLNKFFIEISIDFEKKCLILSRENAEVIPTSKSVLAENLIKRIYPFSAIWSMDLWVDESILEIFINNGEASMSSTFYCDGDDMELEYYSREESSIDISILKMKE